MNTRMIIDKITEDVLRDAKNIFGLKLVDVILFESYARGDYDSESDVDIMILVDMPQEEYAKYRPGINELSGYLSLENDLTVSIKLKDSNIVHRYKDIVPFYANVLSEGVSIDAGLR